MITRIDVTAIVFPNVEIEEGVWIGPYCIVGGRAEINDDWRNKPTGKVVIKAGAVLTGHVTVDGGYKGTTIIGSSCYLMKHTHIGHDAQLGDRVVLSPGACVGGHARLGDDCNLGLNAVIHQSVEIPEKCMVGMGAVVTKKAASKMKEKETWAGNPARFISKNRKWIKS